MQIVINALPLLYWCRALKASLSWASRSNSSHDGFISETREMNLKCTGIGLFYNEECRKVPEKIAYSLKMFDIINIIK
jgi:hypothetical protein